MVLLVVLNGLVLVVNKRYIINYGKLGSSITFPCAFKQAVFITDGMYRGGQNSGNHYQFTKLTTTAFSHAFDSGQSGWYIAIGY